MPPVQVFNNTKQADPDHDLLIELRTEMRGIRGDIKEIKDNSAERLNRLEDGKVDKADLDKLVQQKEKEHATFATKDDLKVLREEMSPVKKVTYGAITIILGAVLSALVYLVVHR